MWTLRRVLRIVIFFVWLARTYGQRSPCPDQFEYEEVGNTLRGRVAVAPVFVGNEMTVVVELSMAAALPMSNGQAYPGNMTLWKNINDVVQDLSRGVSSVEYVISFPLQTPIPYLVKITVSGQETCLGPTGTIAKSYCLTEDECEDNLANVEHR